MQPQNRILIAKAGLDGHDRGAKLVAMALRDAGFEVIYTGLHQLPEEIVKTALEEDVAVIGLSILSGAHFALVARIQQLLSETGASDMKLVVGGFIPPADAQRLQTMGVDTVFDQQSRLDHIVSYFAGQVAQGSIEQGGVRP